MGAGTVARYGHLPALAVVPDFELVSVFDPDPAQLKTTARGFTNSDDFFQSGIDAVVITSPAAAHLQNVLDAARHGKHVLCEKPLALDEPAAQQMITAMHDRGLMLFTAFCYRFSPAALKIKELIATGGIGQARSLRLIYLWDCHGQTDARRHGRMLEGGPMIDCGVHQIDLARWWLGSDVVRQQAQAARVEDYEAPDHVYLHLDHAGGAHTMVEMSYSYTARPVFTYEIIGTDGVIRYDREARTFEVHNSAGQQTFPWSHEKHFEGMYAAFAEALRTGQPGNLATGEDGLAALRIARGT